MREHQAAPRSGSTNAAQEDDQQLVMQQLELGNAAMQEAMAAMSGGQGAGAEDLDAWWQAGLDAPEAASAPGALSGPQSQPEEALAAVGGAEDAQRAAEAPGGGGGSASTARSSGGPTGEPGLDAALGAAFGCSLDGVDASFGEDAENEALGAEAHAEGARASFGAGIQPQAPDKMDPKVLDTIAHEMAHALASAGGPEAKEGVDLEGDQGEAGADKAGKDFSKWATQGFEGEAPQLKPAKGGAAGKQRKAKGGANRLSGTPALRRGSRGGQVSTLQTQLRRHGHKVSVDGDFGPATEAAVRAFQKKKGLSVDGVVGPQTAAKLNAAPAKKNKAAAPVSLARWLPMREGHRNTGVRRAQGLLNRYKAKISTDGVFGPGTKRAVVGFQRANGLSADGVIGPKTAAKLNDGKARDVSYGSGDGGKMPGKYLGQYAAYRYGRYQGMIKVVQMDGKKVALKTARAWKRLKDAARRDGVTLTLNSGFRTMAEQQELYRRYLNGTGNLAARPGYSNHQHGQALDISVVSRSAYNWMHSKAGRYGFRRTVPSEPWHWEYFG